MQLFPNKPSQAWLWLLASYNAQHSPSHNKKLSNWSKMSVSAKVKKLYMPTPATPNFLYPCYWCSLAGSCGWSLRPDTSLDWPIPLFPELPLYGILSQMATRLSWPDLIPWQQGWGELPGLPSDQQQARNCFQQGRGREPHENKLSSQSSVPPKLAPHQAQAMSHYHMLLPLTVTFLYPFISCKSPGAK